MRSLRTALSLSLVFLILCGAAYELFSRARQPVDWTGRPAVTITLTSHGFEPQYAYITRGTTVTFRTTTKAAFWPASDLHPTHTILPEFDPRHPINATSTWSFTFKKDGHWNFHDHIGLATGAVIVVPPGAKGSARYDQLAPCDQKDPAGHAACWKEHLTFQLERSGLKGELAEMANLYHADPKFQDQCHAFAHDIGLTAYDTYGKNPPLTYGTLLCGQGFYHGYMEKFLAATHGDTAAAVRFCEHVASVLSDSPIAGPQCMHGIGHGTMEYFLSTRPDLMQQLPNMISLALAECAKLPNDDAKFRCASGVYAVLKDWINIQNLTSAYPDLFSLKDPFALCKLRPEEWEVQGCAWEMAKETYTLAHFNPGVTLDADMRAGSVWDNGAHLETAIMSTGFVIGELGVTADDRTLANSCSAVKDISLHNTCDVGIVLGLIFNADPSDTVTRPLRYCMSGYLLQSSERACLKQVVESTVDSAGASARTSVCSRIPQTLRDENACPQATTSTE